jgi:DNA-binding protein H-NS
MAKLKLDSLSRSELITLQKDVAKAIVQFEARQRKEALAAVEAKAKEFGFSLAELTGGTKQKRPAVAPKYRHPENANLTWSGRGRKPRWFLEAMKAGTSPDDLLIG